MNNNDFFNVAAGRVQSEIEEHFNYIKPYSTTMLESIRDDLRHYEECACANEQEEIEFINHFLKNCIIIDKNKLLEMIYRQKLLGISNEGNLTDTYRYSLDIERTIKIGKHEIPTDKEDLILKELDKKVYQEFVEYFEEHLGVKNDKI